MMSVYCHDENKKSAFRISIIASTRVARTKTLLAKLAIQPRLDIQPGGGVVSKSGEC